MVETGSLRVLQVHNRYRSSSPGGEDRVVDQEHDALIERGHTVERFERFNDDIEGWSAVRRGIVPGQVVFNPGSRRGLRNTIRRFRPDVVHLHNTFPLLSPSVLYTCRDTSVPLIVTLHNYRLVCATGDLFRDGRVCHDCVGRQPIPAIRHGCYRSSIATVPVAVSSAVHVGAWRALPSAYVFISESQRELLAPFGIPAERSFVKMNLVPGTVVPGVAAAPLPASCTPVDSRPRRASGFSCRHGTGTHQSAAPGFSSSLQGRDHSTRRSPRGPRASGR